MAFYRTGGGGALSETTLWTNPDISQSFAPQNVNLSDNINNYKFIGIKASHLTEADKQTFIMSVSDFKQMSNANNETMLGLSYKSGVGTLGTRGAYYVSDTQIGFTEAKTGTTTVNSAAKPYKIIGLK